MKRLFGLLFGGGVLAAWLAGAMEPQLDIPLVTKMNRLPSPLNIPNWKQDALNYSQFIFDPTVTGSNMPVVNVVGQDFALPGYLQPLGVNGRTSNDVNSTEAMTSVAPVIAAEMLGMDMTTYKGLNWMQSCKRWFDPGCGAHGLYRDGPNQSGGGGYLNPAIYGYWPMAIGMMLTDRHRNDPVFCTNLSLQCASVLQIAQAYGCPTNADFSLGRSYDLATLSVTNLGGHGDWVPGMSAGLGWMLYIGYLWTGDSNYLACAQSALQFYLGYPGRFENAHQYGPLAVARLNAEQGTSMDLGRMMDNFFGDHTRMPLWIQNPPDGYYRHNWSVSRGWSPGGVQADGLDMDSRQNNGVGYAFTMGSYQNTAWLAPVARYDQRFARNIGRFLLNAANSCRLLRGIDLDWNHQAHLGWRTNLVYNGLNKGFLFSYEGLRWESFYPDPSGAIHAPYGSGDYLSNAGAGFGSDPNAAVDYWNAKTNHCPYIPPQSDSTLSYFGWNSFDIAMYMGNSMGFLGAICNTSSVPAIIGWDVVTTDYYHPGCYPSYLFWNPYTTATNVSFHFGNTNCDLYDTVSGVFVARNAQGNYAFTLGADQAMVLVVAPTNGVVSQVGTQLRINGVVVDYRNHGNGLLGEYFSNASQTNRVLARTDAQVNFAWGASSPDPVISSNNFSARWSGWLVPQYSETYTLSTVSGNNVRLWVNDQVVINNSTNWAGGPVTQASVNQTNLSLTNGSFAPFASASLILHNAGTSALYITTAPDGTGVVGSLTDGSLSAPHSTGPLGIAGGTITYNLGSGTNGTGFDVTGIRSLTAWADSGRINPKYTVSSCLDGTNFTTLASVNYAATPGANGTDVKLAVTHLSNVRYIRFDFGSNGSQQNDWVRYTELAVFGTSSSVVSNAWPVGSNACQVVLVANQPVSIRLDYSTSGTNSGVQLFWSSPSLASGLIPSDRLTPAPGTGLQGEYYVGTGLSNLAMVRPDSTIHFNWSANPPAPFLNSRSQSVRWTGWLVPKYTEAHTLTLQANDGARLWLNNQLLIDSWASHTASSSVQVALTNSQPVAVRLEYYNSGLSTPTVSLSWSSPSQPSPEIVPAEQWLPPVGNGLAGEYFNSSGLTNRVLRRTDAQVNFNWNGVAPDPAIYSNKFSVRWSGWLLPRYSETYALTTATRDGVRLWINDQLVINNWIGGAQTNTCSVALTAGQLAKVRMECLNSSGNGLAQLSWSSPSQALEIIPQSQLIGPAAPPAPASAAIAPPNLPPLLTAISDQTVRASSSLNFTVSASDLDLPPQMLTYSLDPGPPSGASINPVTGQFSWTPLLGQYPGTYVVTVRVTDNGNPPLSATSTFSVTVLAPPPPPPVVSETDLTFNSPSQTFAPLATNDLILGNAGDSSALNYFEATGGWTPANLTDGDLKAPGTVGNGTGVYSIITRGTVTYNLGGGAKGTGYTITGIRSLTSWSGGGRVRPNYTVNFSLDGIYFYPIATVNYLAPDYTQGPNLSQGTDVTLGVTGLTNVVSIQFVFPNTQQNGGVTYTELAVFGRSSRGTNIAPTQLVLSSSANPSFSGTNVTFTATVQAGGFTAGDATSNVVFQVDGTAVFTNGVVSGSATYTNGSLALGMHSITVIYRGDVNYAASTNTLTQSIYLAPVVTETDLSLTNGSFAPLATNDLILGNAGVAALTTVTHTGTATNLTDGVLQAPGSPGTSAQIVMIQNGTVTYNLGNGANGAGYNLTGIRSLTAWANGTRINPKYTVSYSWDGTNYLPLATVNYAAPATAKGTDVTLGITGLANVKSLQFNFPNSQQNSGVAYSEVAAFGTSTPVVTPSLGAQLLPPGLTNLVLNLRGLQPGQSYTLQSSTSLVPAAWSNADPFVATQTTAAITNAAGTNTMQFFRLEY